MFGYVQIRKPELKIKDYDTYHSFYCGLCHILYERFGIRGQVTLTYDMTFLVLLLSSYYESEVKTEKRRCIVHPARAHVERMTEMTAYMEMRNPKIQTESRMMIPSSTGRIFAALR